MFQEIPLLLLTPIFPQIIPHPRWPNFFLLGCGSESQSPRGVAAAWKLPREHCSWGRTQSWSQCHTQGKAPWLPERVEQVCEDRGMEAMRDKDRDKERWGEGGARKREREQERQTDRQAGWAWPFERMLDTCGCGGMPGTCGSA